MFNHTLGYSCANRACWVILVKLCHVMAVYAHSLLVPRLNLY